MSVPRSVGRPVESSVYSRDEDGTISESYNEEAKAEQDREADRYFGRRKGKGKQVDNTGGFF